MVDDIDHLGNRRLRTLDELAVEELRKGFLKLKRRYMLEALSCVHEVHVGSGSGQMDFVPEFENVRPDVFVVNADGHAEAKAELCRERGVRYVVLVEVATSAPL